MNQKTRNEALTRYVEEHGAERLSKSLECSTAAVYHWCNGTRRISAELAVRIEKATAGKISRADLRPDLFDCAA